MSAVTPDGFICDDLITIKAGLEGKMRGIFGDDIDLDPDTVDGQTLGIFAEAKVDSDQLAEDVYNNWNPQTATGVALSRVVQFNGIRRIPAEASIATITCGGTMGTHIPIGSLIASEVDQQRWHTIQDAFITETGAVNIWAMSVNYGAVQAAPGTLTQIITPVWGWQTVTNVEKATIGRNEETDEELRIRRALSTKTPAQAVPESIYGAIANIPRVTQVRLYENYMELPTDNLPPHSYCVVVQGGDDYDIASTIWNRASLGATQVGNTNVWIADIQGFPHVITFQRPLLVRIYVAITIRPLAGWNSQLISEIQNNLADWALDNWQIGSEIIHSRVYEPLNELPKVFSVTSLAVDTVTPAIRMSDIQLPFAALATLAPADVTVNFGDYNPDLPTPPPTPPPPIVLPTISNISPNTGSVTGGTAVTIEGTNFVVGEEVTFGNVAATNIVVVNSTTITCVSPPNPAGAVAVTVSLSGQSVSLGNGFTYVTLAPTIILVDPNSGPTTGPGHVTITGTNFINGTWVALGEPAYANMVGSVVENSTTIIATFGARFTPGWYPVIVTNPNGQSVTLAQGYRYI